jgi:hypothetical protein
MFFENWDVAGRQKHGKRQNLPVRHRSLNRLKANLAYCASLSLKKGEKTDASQSVAVRA